MKQIERVPVVGQVADGIQLLINERGLKENDKLPTEKELCELFNVGRSTVREAARVLQTLGVLVNKPGKGVFVASQNMDDTEILAKRWFNNADVKLSDFVEIRLAIEPLCVRLAIQRTTEEEIAEIARIHSLFIQASANKMALQLATYDEMFHMEIARATHNQLMVNIQETIKKEVFEMRVNSFAIPERMPGAIGPHDRILNAFYTKDQESGAREMTNHIKDAFARVAGHQILEEKESGERPISNMSMNHTIGAC